MVRKSGTHILFLSASSTLPSYLGAEKAEKEGTELERDTWLRDKGREETGLIFTFSMCTVTLAPTRLLV